MWGPPDAVQYAVRHNAERMGIDPACVEVFFPFWEQGGSPTNLTDEKAASMDSPIFWDGASLKWPDGNGSTNITGIKDPDIYPLGTKSFTIVVTVKAKEYSNSYCYILSLIHI